MHIRDRRTAAINKSKSRNAGQLELQRIGQVERRNYRRLRQPMQATSHLLWPILHLGRAVRLRSPDVTSATTNGAALRWECADYLSRRPTNACKRPGQAISSIRE